MCEDAHFYPVFEQMPGDDYVSGWRDFIAKTGCPEHFENVSTNKPSQMENIVLLSEEIAVPINLRPEGDRVPCPFCSPNSPKFIRGRMAYFPDERVTRFIGHRCASAHFGENFKHAERMFRRQGTCRDYIEIWAEIAEHRDDLARFVDDMNAVATDVQFAREQLDQQAPGFCNFLHRELAQTNGELFIEAKAGVADRHGNVVAEKKNIGKASGLAFLGYGYDVAREIRNLRAALVEAGRPLPDWSPSTPEHPATDEILKRGKIVEKAMKGMLETLANINDGKQFFTKRNINMLHRWGNRPNTPFSRFDIQIDDRQVLIRSKTFGGEHYANVIVADGLHKPLPAANDLAIIQRKVG